MKITIEPNKNNIYSKVTVEVPEDDLTFYEVIEKLVAPALLGAGYPTDSIKELLNQYKPDECPYCDYINK